MNCHEVNALLVPFLNWEVAPSEDSLIQTHLAGCPACQQKLSTLYTSRNRLIRSMKLQAAEATPSPQAWSRLQVRLAEGTQSSPAWLKRLASKSNHPYHQAQTRFNLKTGITFALLIILIITVFVFAFVPSVQAQVGRIIAGVLPSPLESKPGACSSVKGGWVGSGVFIWPTALHMISGSDYDTSTGHLAIDLAASLDAPVVAMDAGVVIFSGQNNYNWGYGNTVIIDHRNGWESLYAHLDAVKTVCGENVRQGQLIGLAGQTGNSPTIHLHLELLQIGAGGQVNKVNPHLYLPQP